MPIAQRITFFTAWGKKKGGDRLPEAEYKTDNNTLRYILTSYFPEDKKGIAWPVYLYVECCFPLHDISEDEELEQQEILLNRTHNYSGNHSIPPPIHIIQLGQK